MVIYTMLQNYICHEKIAKQHELKVNRQKP